MTYVSKTLLMIGFIVTAFCVGCSSASSLNLSALPAQGDAAAGLALFQTGTRSAVACGSCHAIDNPSESGPNLNGIATSAGTRVPGQTAETYLFNAIVNPNDYLVSGFAGGLMPTTYGSGLSSQQIRDLLTYLLTLR